MTHRLPVLCENRVTFEIVRLIRIAPNHPIHKDGFGESAVATEIGADDIGGR